MAIAGRSAHGCESSAKGARTTTNLACSPSCRRTRGCRSPSSAGASGSRRPAVADRLARLEEDGVIRGYHAEIDPRALGYALSVVIRIRPAPRELRKGRRRSRARRPRSSAATA
jgi:Lrp/AsnC family leucine-responsive transcriptional regulator